MTVPCNYDPYEGRYDGFLASAFHDGGRTVAAAA